jgi:hypothetical protein
MLLMAVHVDIRDDVLETIASWNLPSEVHEKLLRTMLNDLSTRRTNAIGPEHSVAPVHLNRYSLAIADPGGAYLHNFVFLVNVQRERRIVMLGNHRVTGQEF